MLKLLKLFAWLIVGGILLIAFDQFLVRIPLDVPGVSQAQTFYVDFRSRLLGLVGIDGVAKRPEKSIEQLIETTSAASTPKTQPPQRYLFVDETGTLQFADSIELVPARFRDSAQPLAE